ncbi:unnamed protein product [Schistosoma turkestanicum]|nr:unnamed protein product [Schistosoma turkestanicum]
MDKTKDCCVKVAFYTNSAHIDRSGRLMCVVHLINSNKMCSKHSFTINQIEKLHETLLQWYDKSKRDLPWRQMVANNPDANLRGYAVWISEVMLQQTQVNTVIDYYNRWMKKWPSVDRLASATLDDVNCLWSGLGYYSRARLLHEAAKKIVNEFNGEFPQSAEVLKRTLPGVGRYTAGAIASIAFNQCTPVLDGNVIRILTRLRRIGSPIQLNNTMEYLWNLTTQLIHSNRPGDFNQALMEFGALYCAPKNPNCIQCPLHNVDLCESFKQVVNENNSDNMLPDIENCHLCIDRSVYQKSLGVMNYPVKLTKREPRKQNTLILITYISKQDSETLENYYLLLQRPKTGLLAGLWEFPSYTIENDNLTNENQSAFISLILDRIANALNCSLNQLTSIVELMNMKSIGELLHIFSHIRMTYIVFTLKIEQQHQLTMHSDWPPNLNSGRWVSREDLNDSAISTATRKIFSHFENYSKTSDSKINKNPRKTKRTALHKSSSIVNDVKQPKLDDFFH